MIGCSPITCFLTNLVIFKEIYKNNLFQSFEFKVGTVSRPKHKGKYRNLCKKIFFSLGWVRRGYKIDHSLSVNSGKL